MPEFVTYPRWLAGEDAVPASSRAATTRAATPTRSRPALWLWAVFLGWQLAYMMLRLASADTIPRTYGSKEVERVLFGGTLPATWLQDTLYDGLPLANWDWYAVVVYFSMSVLPFALALVLTVFRSRELPAFLLALTIAHALGALGHIIAPVLAPWRFIDLGTVHGIVHELLRGSSAVEAALLAPAFTPFSPPMLAATIVGLAVGRSGWLGRLWGGAWIGSAALSLVYLGERYVVDAVAGMLVGFLVWHVSQAIWGYFDWRAGNRPAAA